MAKYRYTGKRALRFTGVLDKDGKGLSAEPGKTYDIKGYVPEQFFELASEVKAEEKPSPKPEPTLRKDVPPTEADSKPEPTDAQ